MTETLITANVPEWITSFLGFIALITGLGFLSFVWIKLKPLVKEQIEIHLEPIHTKVDTHSELIERNRKAIEDIKEMEYKQDKLIDHLNTKIEHIESSITEIKNDLKNEIKKDIKGIYNVLLGKNNP